MHPVIEVEVALADAEVAADRLWSLGVSAIEERAARDATVVTLAAGVNVAEVDRVVAALRDQWPVRVVEVDDRGWADAWKQWATDVRVGQRLRIHPAWLPDTKVDGGHVDGEIVIVLDPGRAFGSGTHPTTRLVLTELERRLRPGDRVLDVGSGSGVLAVAAALLGAASVTAVDIDPEAVSTTIENANRNGVASVVHAVTGDITATDGIFDVVVVNIGASAIVGAAAGLAAHTASDGLLLAAGFLADRAAGVSDAFRPCALQAEVLDGEWCALVLRKERAS